MIGIISAMTEELDIILQNMTEDKVEHIASFDFHIGKINGVDCVAVISGIGKVAAATCTQIMILKYNVKNIINTGVAGGTEKYIKLGDIVIADAVLEHDFDLTALGSPKGELMDLGMIKIPSQSSFVDNLNKSDDYSIYVGTVMSGDQFVSSNDKIKQLKNDFGGLACDMESASIGHVCYLNKVPFIIIRAISDGANDGAEISYEQFKIIASNRSAKLVLDLISILKLS